MATNRYNNGYGNKPIAYADVAKMRERTLRMIGDEKNSMYIDGNTVRVTEPEYEPDYEEKRRKKTVKEDRKNRKAKENRVTYSRKPQTQSMNAVGTLALVAAVVFTLTFCVQYLQVQAEISEKSSYVVQLKKDIDTMTTQNNALDYSISSYIDVDYIYKIATEEMGMVVAGENQVKLYDSTEIEYMKQLSDIPAD